MRELARGAYADELLRQVSSRQVPDVEKALDVVLSKVVSHIRALILTNLIDRLEDEVKTMQRQRSHVLGFVDGIEHCISEVFREATR